jgi:hypothetical protein
MVRQVHHERNQRLTVRPEIRRTCPGCPSNYSVHSIAIYARHGELLRLTLASDQQYRVWILLAEIPETPVPAHCCMKTAGFIGIPALISWHCCVPHDRRFSADFALPLTVYSKADNAPHLTD